MQLDENCRRHSDITGTKIAASREVSPGRTGPTKSPDDTRPQLIFPQYRLEFSQQQALQIERQINPQPPDQDSHWRSACTRENSHQGECLTAIRYPPNRQNRHDYVHVSRQGGILPDKPGKKATKAFAVRQFLQLKTPASRKRRRVLHLKTRAS